MKRVRTKNLVLAVAGVLSLLAIFYVLSRPGKEVGQKNSIIPKFNIEKSPSGSIPESFPKDIALSGKRGENDAYTLDYHELGAKQSTVNFISFKSPVVNYEYYEKWAIDNGWQIINKVSFGEILGLYLRKGTEDINITIHGNEVNLSYLNKSQ